MGFSSCSNSDLEAKLAELEAQITQQQTQIEALAQEKEELQADIAEQQEQIEELQQEKQELEEEIDYLESQINENVVSGTFYSLEEAYQNGWFTQQKFPKDLNLITKMSIKQTFWDDYYESGMLDHSTLDSIGGQYYGTYNDCVAVLMVCRDWGYSLVVGKEVISGISILYSYENKIKIWKKD